MGMGALWLPNYPLFALAFDAVAEEPGSAPWPPRNVLWEGDESAVDPLNGCTSAIEVALATSLQVSARFSLIRGHSVGEIAALTFGRCCR